MRGIESQGMMLASGEDDVVMLTTLKEVKPGEVIR